MGVIRNMLTRNLGLKLLSLVIAVVLWFFAVGRERAEVGISVPLELVNFPPNTVIANQVPDGVSVRIRGSVAITRQVADRKLRFSLDLAGSKIGTNEFTLKAETLGLPRGMEIIRMAPSTVTVELEKLIQKKVGLLPVIKGEPVTGFIIEDIQLTPKYVEIRGPESLVKTLGIIWTDPIDVTQLDKSAKVKTKPALPDVALSLVGESEVTAELRVGEKMNARTFKEVPVEVINTDLDYKIEPQAVDLVIRGPMSTMTYLASGKALAVRVSLSGLAPGRHQVEVQVTVPTNMDVLSVDPERVTAEIFEKPTRREDEQQQENFRH